MPRALQARGPNQLFSWDITYLPTRIKGIYFYLYLFMDLFSRKIVGWQIYETESSELAAEVVRDICERENIAPHQVVLHSDNGSPMKGSTMLATLQALGRSEEHTSELQSLMSISYAVFCLKKKND